MELSFVKVEHLEIQTHVFVISIYNNRQTFSLAFADLIELSGRNALDNEILLSVNLIPDD